MIVATVIGLLILGFIVRLIIQSISVAISLIGTIVFVLLMVYLYNMGSTPNVKHNEALAKVSTVIIDCETQTFNLTIVDSDNDTTISYPTQVIKGVLDYKSLKFLNDCDVVILQNLPDVGKGIQRAFYHGEITFEPSDTYNGSSQHFRFHNIRNNPREFTDGHVYQWRTNIESECVSDTQTKYSFNWVQ